MKVIMTTPSNQPTQEAMKIKESIKELVNVLFDKKGL